MLLGINVSPTISRQCCHGFVIRSRLSAILGNLFTLQGTKVLEDREVRAPFCCVAEGAPPRQGFNSVVKYTGSRTSPEWMDLERGNVFV